jgi:hypothetical protein
MVDVWRKHLGLEGYWREDAVVRRWRRRVEDSA